MPHADFVERAAALMLDVIAVCLLWMMIGFGHGFLGGRLMLVFLAYHVGFWTWQGTTPGGLITRLRVIKTDGTAPQFADALIRGLAGIFSLAVLGLGFLWILKDAERQGWHDLIAGTYVVKVPRV
jgi:uncharacterized RDD family membrane protein YckC